MSKQNPADPDIPKNRPETGTSIPSAESGRGSLDRRRILGAAVRLIDEHGIRALTMRMLGSHLGVEAMAVYHYVPSREAVLDGVVELMIEELYNDPDVHPSTGSWQEYMQRLAHGVRRVALAHPQIFPLVATRPPEAPWIRPPLRSVRWAESFFEALTSCGFSDTAAVAAYRGFTSFLLGHLLLEVSAQGADVGPMDQPDPHEDEDADLGEYPLVERLEKELSEDRSAEEFEISLESLLDRLGQQLAV